MVAVRVSLSHSLARRRKALAGSLSAAQFSNPWGPPGTTSSIVCTPASCNRAA
ncbi:Protein of unknown function [Propionibacterium freudenreichii]|nr:Protein of unknown function [Propionibacterium freudenreichii]